MNKNESQEIEQEIDLLSYLLVILRYWWVIAPLTAIGAVSAYFIAQALPEKFEANCRFEIIQNKVSQISEDVEDQAFEALQNQRNFSPLNRHIVLLKSDKLNEQVERNVLPEYPKLMELRELDEDKEIFEIKISPVKGAERSMLDIAIISTDPKASENYLKIYWHHTRKCELKKIA